MLSRREVMATCYDPRQLWARYYALCLNRSVVCLFVVVDLSLHTQDRHCGMAKPFTNS